MDGIFLYFFVFRCALHEMQPQKNPNSGIKSHLEIIKDRSSLKKHIDFGI